MPDLDVLSHLPSLKWRDVEVPVQTNSIRFEHGLVEHRQPGVDGGHQENTGRGSMVITVRIPFRAGIIEYPDLYPERFRDFWNACLDGSVGDLAHSEFGIFEAKVASFALAVDPARRDGYDVDVEFRETTENEITAADNPLGPIAAAMGIAQAFNKEFAGVPDLPKYDDGSGTDLLTGLKQLQGSLQLLEMTIAGKIAKINNIISALNSMIDTGNHLTDPKSWAILDSLKEIWLNLQTAKENLAPEQRKINYIVAPREIAVTDAAAKAGMDISEFFSLNPILARSKAIKAGKEYFVFT